MSRMAPCNKVGSKYTMMKENDCRFNVKKGKLIQIVEDIEPKSLLTTHNGMVLHNGALCCTFF
jgi:hypothetical protein